MAMGYIMESQKDSITALLQFCLADNLEMSSAKMNEFHFRFLVRPRLIGVFTINE